MVYFKTVADKKIIENEMPFDARFKNKTMHSFLRGTVNKFPNRSALSF